MLPEYNENRLKISFLSPVLISVCSAFFKINYAVSLLITLLETFFFWLLIVLFAEIFINLNVTDREPKWKDMMYYANIVILPLFLTGCLLPASRNMRNSLYPSDNDWDTVKALASDPAYQFWVLIPNIIAIITVILIIALLSISLYELHEIEFLKSLLFSTAIGILSFTISTVFAGQIIGS